MRPDVLSRKIVASPLLARSDELPQRTLPSIHNNSTAHLRCRRPVARRLSAFHAAITIAVLTGILLLALSYNSKRNLTFGDEAIGQLSPGGNKDKNTGKRLTSWTFDALLPLMQHGESNDDGSFSDSSRAAPYQPPGSSSAPITPSPKVADETSSPVAERYEESGKGKYRIPSNELDDVFLRRPNWRRADTQRRSYSFSLTDPSPFPYDDGKQRFGKSHFSFEGQEAQRGNDFKNDEEDADIIRVLIVIFSNRLDAQTCSMVASAYLSGLPIVVLGDGHVYNNFTDKHYETLKMVRKAGLRPQDVVVVLDADMLFASGPEFVRSVDRFIRYSPASEAELSVQDVRDDYGDMIAPVMFSADYTCKFPDLVGHVMRFECNPLYLHRGLDPFDQYMQRVFLQSETSGDATPSSHVAGKKRKRYESLATFTAPFLNAGAHISRVWAFDAFMKSFKVFTDAATAPWANRMLAHHGWTCDQSIAGELFSQLLTWEMDVDIFNERWGNRIVHEEGKVKVGNPAAAEALRRWNLLQPGPYGLPLGLLSVDFRNEWFFAAAYENHSSVKLYDRYWRPARRSAEMTTGPGKTYADALREETAKVFSLSFAPKQQWRDLLHPGTARTTATSHAVELQVSHLYFAPRTTANDGISNVHEEDLSTSNAEAREASELDAEGGSSIFTIRRQPVSSLNRCHIEALLRANVHLHRTEATHAAVTGDGDLFGAYFEECLLTARDNNNNNNNNSAAWPGLLSTDAVPFFTVQPLPRSRHPNITSILTAPLVFAVSVHSQPEKAAGVSTYESRFNGGVPLREAVLSSDALTFPSLIHFQGPGKRYQIPTLLPSMSWGVPLFFSHVNAREFTEPNALSDSDSETAAHSAIRTVQQAKNFLYAMPLELWGSDHRRRVGFQEKCQSHVNNWLVNRDGNEPL